MEPTYKLPEAAKDILEELAEGEMNQSAFYLFLSFWCGNEGYIHAADHFYQQSKDERSHFNNLVNMMTMRGVPPFTTKVKPYSEKFTDLKAVVKAAYELEISATQKYDEAVRQMFTIDIMVYQDLLNTMAGQRYALERFQDMWAVFSKMESLEDQIEADMSFFGPKTGESIAPASA